MLQLRYKNSNKGPLWLVESQYTIGSDSQGDICLDGQGIRPHHATIEVDGDDIKLINHIGDGISVNAIDMETEQKLVSGDTVVVGTSVLQVVDPKNAYKPKADQAAGSATWSLRAMSTAMSEQEYPIVNTAVIGRSKECDISLSLVHLSRRHAQLTVTGKGLEIKDLQSSNGTFVNGKRIESTILHPGDELSFDTLRFRVTGPEEVENQTVMRPSGDATLTTVRPAISTGSTFAKPASGASSPQLGGAAASRPQATSRSNTGPRPAINMNESEIPKKTSVVGWVVLGGIFVVLGVYAIYSGLIPLG